MSTRNSHSSANARPVALVLGIAALLGLSGLVLAQPQQASFGPPAFGTMDLNGDARVSAAEFAQHRAERMAARAAEGRPMRNAANAPTFESLDTDGNGFLTPVEVTQGQQARFASRGPGYGRGYGAGYGPGAGMGGRHCWRNQ